MPSSFFEISGKFEGFFSQKKFSETLAPSHLFFMEWENFMIHGNPQTSVIPMEKFNEFVNKKIFDVQQEGQSTLFLKIKNNKMAKNLLLGFLILIFFTSCEGSWNEEKKIDLNKKEAVIPHGDLIKLGTEKTKPNAIQNSDTLNQTQSIPDIITLPNVNFENNKAILKEGSFQSLDLLADLMIRNGEMNIEISGHTDNVEKPETNRKLSQDRADAIKKYLENKGVEANRIVAKGRGAEVPIGDNNTEEGRMLNQRIEVSVKNNRENFQKKELKQCDVK